MSGELIGEIIDKWGIWGIVAFIFALVSFAVFLKYVTKISTQLPFIRDGIRNQIDFTLKDHLFFTHSKYKLRFDIPTLELAPNKPVLQRAFSDIIYLNVESFYYGCKRIVEIHDLNSLSGSEWGSMTKSELTRMLKSYEEKAEDMGIPTPIIRRYTKWLNTYIDLLNSYIDQLSISTAYGNSVLRMNVFLLVMNLLIVTMMGDLDKLVRESEDEFSGLTYRNNVIE